MGRGFINNLTIYCSNGVHTSTVNNASANISDIYIVHMDVVVFAYAVFENAAYLIKIQTKGVDLH